MHTLSTIVRVFAFHVAVLCLLALPALTGCRADGEARDARPERPVQPIRYDPFDAYDPVLASAAATDTTGLDEILLAEALARFDALPHLRALVVARHGDVLAERYRAGYGLDVPANVKSVSKSVLSAITGATLAGGAFEQVNAPVAPLFEPELARLDGQDPRVFEITWEDLLTMRAGLASTSGRNYGPWVSADDWVEAALARPMVAAPGTRRIYSTGTSHLLGVALSRAADEDLLTLARRTLGNVLDVPVPAWPVDPQGYYFGGNDMALSPRALLRLGEAYRQGGRLDTGAGPRRLVSASWVRASWTPRTEVGRGRGHRYGYGWFMKAVHSGGRVIPVYFAWGYGGQFLFVVPELALTVVALSDPAGGAGGERGSPAIHALLDEALIPAAQAGSTS